jgi:hypothetical protein
MAENLTKGSRGGIGSECVLFGRILSGPLGPRGDLVLDLLNFEWPRETLSGSLAPVGLAALRQRQGQVSDGFANAWLV